MILGTPYNSVILVVGKHPCDCVQWTPLQDLAQMAQGKLTDLV